MKHKSLFSSIVIIALIIQTNLLQAKPEVANKPESFEWAIVGAGLGGITALAILMDCGVEPSSIAWIDPEFQVGRVGKYYRNVPGNVQTHRLILYVESCPFFKNINSATLKALYACDPDKFQPLHVIADPLLDFTEYLCNKVTPVKDEISSLARGNDHWILEGNEYVIHAQKVILAIGGSPKRLNYDIEEIPLDEALDKNKLPNYVSPDDSIAVFGGMHSAILILKYLSELSVKQIFNFYIDPYFYGAPGLEGDTATWAQEVLENNTPANLIRVLSNCDNREKILPLCNKVIYAIGYEQNKILVNGSSCLTFDENTGIIDCNLYGIGMAFPPTGIFHGQKVAKNGLHTYLNYGKKLIPAWVAAEVSNDKNPIKVTNPSLQTQLVSSHEISTNQELPWI